MFGSFKQFSGKFEVDLPDVRGWMPLPDEFSAENVIADVTQIYNVDTNSIIPAARQWAAKHGVKPSAGDRFKVLVMLIDPQLTFTHPSFELFVGGASGLGSFEDVARLTRFIAGNAPYITDIAVTLDTHKAGAVFHESFLVDASGNHVAPFSSVSVDDVMEGRVGVDPGVIYEIFGNPSMYNAAQDHLLSYVKQLKDNDRYALTVWPYHAMLMTIGHAVHPVLNEAIFWHQGLRRSRYYTEIKGGNPLFENYSVYRTEVAQTKDPNGKVIVSSPKNTDFLKNLMNYDMVIAAGEAASHCFAWTIEDMLNDIKAQDPSLAEKFHILVDGTSPIVIHDANGQIIPNADPNVPTTDFRGATQKKFAEFEAAGMKLVNTTTPITEMPGYKG